MQVAPLHQRHDPVAPAQQLQPDVAGLLGQGDDLRGGGQPLVHVVGPGGGVAAGGDGRTERRRAAERPSEADGVVGQLQPALVGAHERQRHRQAGEHERPEGRAIVEDIGRLLQQRDLARLHERHLDAGQAGREPEGGPGDHVPAGVPPAELGGGAEGLGRLVVVARAEPGVAGGEQRLRPPQVALDALRGGVEGPLAQVQRLGPGQPGQGLLGGADGQGDGPDVAGLEAGPGRVVGEQAGVAVPPRLEDVEHPPVEVGPLARPERLVAGGPHEVVHERPAVGSRLHRLRHPGPGRLVEGGDDAVVRLAGDLDEHVHVEGRADDGGDRQDPVAGHRQAGQAPGQHLPHPGGDGGRCARRQQAADLGDEQRVAARLPVHRPHLVGRRLPAERRGQDRRHLVLGQAGEREPLGRAADAGQLGRVQLVVPERHGHQRGHGRQVGRHPPHERERRGVRPVDVLEDDDLGPAGGLPLERVDDVVEQAAAGPGRRGGVGGLAGAGVAEAGDDLVAQVAPRPAEGVDPGGERQEGAALPAGAPPHDGAPVAGVLGQGPHERRLAHAGLAGDEQQPARPRERGRQHRIRHPSRHAAAHHGPIVRPPGPALDRIGLVRRPGQGPAAALSAPRRRCRAAAPRPRSCPAPAPSGRRPRW